MDCWSCTFPMNPRRLDEVDHFVCPACDALVMNILSSLPLWRAMEEARLPEPSAPDAPPPESCARCRRPVEAFGYQFTDVTVYRCTPCRLLFVPGARQLDVRNIWRKANDREERKLVREAREAEEALASRVARKPPTLGMSLQRRMAVARTNARLETIEAQEEAARAAAAALLESDE